jgi:hypothetical protein
MQRSARHHHEVRQALERASVARRLLPNGALPVSELPTISPSQQRPSDWLSAHPIPSGPRNDVEVPIEACSYNYHERAISCFTVRELADEYFGTRGSFGSKDLELRFGEGVPGIKVGKSWRSKKARLQYSLELTPSITSLWSRNAAM